MAAALGRLSFNHVAENSGARHDYSLVPICAEHHRGAAGLHGMGPKAFVRLYRPPGDTEWGLVRLASRGLGEDMTEERKAVSDDEETKRRLERRSLARASWINEFTLPQHAYGNGNVYQLTAKDCRSLAWFLQEAVELQREVASLRAELRAARELFSRENVGLKEATIEECAKAVESAPIMHDGVAWKSMPVRELVARIRALKASKTFFHVARTDGVEINWIPISERPPEAGQDIIVWGEDTNGCQRGWAVEWGDQSDLVNQSWLKRWKVTHWMPMPTLKG